MAPDGTSNSESTNSSPPNPPNPSSTSVLPANATMDDLLALLAQRVVSQINMATPVPATNNPPNVTAAPAATPTPIQSELDAFIPPISQNPAAGMSFDRMFYNVDTALRLAIAKHEFRPEHLWKLDSTPVRGQVKSRSFEIDDEGVIVKHERTATAKDYPNPRSLVDPLIRYFLMLQIYVTHSSGPTSAIQVMYHTSEYLRQLQTLISEYDWTAVLRYHFEFHAIRLVEMREGQYHGWSSRDRDLWAQFLDGHIKTSQRNSTTTSNAKQTCFSFQSGKCASPCAHGRLHICKSCKSDKHGSKSCTEKKADV